MMRIIILICLMFTAACSDPDLKVHFENEITHSNGFQDCIDNSELISKAFCQEKRAYTAQINNNDSNRFDHLNYEPLANNGALEGKWLLINMHPVFSDGIRETCDIKLSGTAETYSVQCRQVGEYTESYDTFTVDLDESIVTFVDKVLPSFHPETNEPTLDHIKAVAEIVNKNLMYVEHSVSRQFENGDVFHSTSNRLFALVRLGGVEHVIGQLTVKKLDYEKNLLLMEQYAISHFREAGKEIELFDESGQLLAKFSDFIRVDNTEQLTGGARLYGNQYNVDLLPGVSRDLFDGVMDSNGDFRILPEGFHMFNDFELRLRQFDYVKNDAEGLSVDFLLNRRFAERFERGDTVGKIRITF